MDYDDDYDTILPPQPDLATLKTSHDRMRENFETDV